MKLLQEIFTWAVFFVICALMIAICFFVYVEHKECEQRGGEMIRKPFGAVCAKVEKA